ncbi:uncharacterized protein LOC113509116 isoform X2 [Galleria mellonella]|uniref:Uncharacterized protein LOC113509116 isoform X2 n=1 Tax=Galleria mellonella TaxID=7137 RepID=A0A6J3BT14_GALME|nr:uncharacterized protein LOC113509116 isoform X2 [Galleria mellonella]
MFRFGYAQHGLEKKCVIRGASERKFLPIYVWIILTICVAALLCIVSLLYKTRVLSKIVYSIMCTATEQPQRHTYEHAPRNDPLFASAPQYSDITPTDSRIPSSRQDQQMTSVPKMHRPPLYNTYCPRLENEPLILDHNTPEEPINSKPIIPTCPRNAYESVDHHSAVVFNKAIYDSEDVFPPIPTTEVWEDTEPTQIDGNVEVIAAVDMESNDANQLAVLAQNSNSPITLNIPSNVSSILHVNTSTTTVSNPSVPTSSATPMDTEVSCSNSTIVNQMTCTFSTAHVDQGSLSTITVQNTNIVQVQNTSGHN